MRERPILFSAPMVRAILEGRKTQTRRAVNPQPTIKSYSMGGLALYDCGKHGARFLDSVTCRAKDKYPHCPYGAPGDMLYVRETWAETDLGDGTPVVTYAAGGCIAVGRERASAKDHLIPEYTWPETPTPERWRPSIHMPRWASRITLEVTGVRVERLQDISDDDALAEGVESLDSDAPEERTHHDFDHALCTNCGGLRLYMGGGLNGVTFDLDCMECDTHAKRFRALWESINGPDSWDANPWVWVVEFCRVQP